MCYDFYMKFICDGEELAEAVATVSRASNARAINPILEGIKITAKDGAVTLAATDLEMYVQKTIRADIQIAGTAVVPGKLFSEYIGRLGAHPVTVSMEGETMRVVHGENVLAFQCLLLVEYPDIINISKKPHFSIKSDDLRDFITKARVSASGDDSRPILKGILCEVGKDTMTGVALDGFRLSKVEKPVKNHADEIKVVVPVRSFDEIKKLIADDNGEVSVILDKKFFQINIGKVVFAGRLIDGEFINYNQIIPTKFESNVVVERAGFDKAVDRAGLLGRSDKINLVTLGITDKLVSITSNNEIGQIAEKVAAKLTGKDIKIAFNAKYLSDVLKATAAEFVKISFNGELGPCIIEPAKAADHLFLVLPVRI